MENQQHFANLDAILRVLGEGTHYWDLPNYELVIASSWVTTDEGYTGELKREFIKKCASSNIYKTIPKLKCKIVETIKDPQEIPLECAEEWLRSPLYLIVEDGISDRYFIECICEVYKRDRLQRLIRAERIMIDHGGGINRITNRIEQLKKNMHEKYHYDLPLRIIVVTDNDRKFPTDVSQPVIKTLDYCAENNITCIVLKRRTIENYIPCSVLKKWASNENKTEIVEAFSKLNSNQKSFYHLRNGLLKDIKKRAGKLKPDELEQLYEDVSKPDRQILLRGFGDIAEIFVNHRSQFNKKELEEHCTEDSKELQTLLNKIEKEL